MEKELYDIKLSDLIASYPDINDPNFTKDIYRKKEFLDLKLEKNEKIDDKNEGLNHQKIISIFLSSYTMYDSLLLFHQMGTGKSIASIVTSERLLSEKFGITKACFFSNTEIIRDNLQSELLKFNPKYYPENYETLLREKTNPKRSIQAKLQENNYYFMTFNELVKDLKRGNSNFYENSLLVFDEIHDITKDDAGKDEQDSSITNKDKYEYIKRLIRKLKNKKVLLMSGTPMTDKANEIAKVLNLILEDELLDGKNFDKEYLNSNKIMNNETKINNFVDKIKGYVSYLRMSNTVPVKFKESKDKYDLQLAKLFVISSIDIQDEVYTSLFTKKDDKEEEEIGKVRLAVMAYFEDKKEKGRVIKYWEGIYDNPSLLVRQIYDYKKNKELGSIDEFTREFQVLRDNMKDKLSAIFSLDTRQAGLFVFPDGTYGEKGSKKYITSYKKKYYGIDKYYTDYKFNDKLSDTLNNMTLKDLKKYSIKYYNVLKKIQSSPGECHFVYCDLISGSGIRLFSLLLQKILKFKKISKSQSNLSEEDRYMMLTGENYQEDINKLIKRFNQEDNSDGKYIRVILGTDKVKQGVSFFHIKHIHILTPHWNYSKIEQVIARGIRLDSQKFLTNKGVNVYLYCIRSSMDFSKDIKIYEEAEKKDKSIKSVEYVIKKNSIDCNLFYKRNYNEEFIDDSRDCEYNKCEYVCDVYDSNTSKDKVSCGIDSKDCDFSSYNEYFNICKVQDKILNLFLKYDYVSLDDLVVHYKEHPYYVLNCMYNIINKNIPVMNKYGFTCYVREKNDIFFLIYGENSKYDEFSYVYNSKLILNYNISKELTVIEKVLILFDNNQSNLHSTIFKTLSMNDKLSILYKSILDKYINKKSFGFSDYVLKSFINKMNYDYSSKYFYFTFNNETYKINPDTSLSILDSEPDLLQNKLNKIEKNARSQKIKYIGIKSGYNFNDQEQKFLIKTLQDVEFVEKTKLTKGKECSSYTNDEQLNIAINLKIPTDVIKENTNDICSLIIKTLYDLKLVHNQNFDEQKYLSQEPQSQPSPSPQTPSPPLPQIEEEKEEIKVIPVKSCIVGAIQNDIDIDEINIDKNLELELEWKLQTLPSSQKQLPIQSNYVINYKGKSIKILSIDRLGGSQGVYGTNYLFTLEGNMKFLLKVKAKSEKAQKSIIDLNNEIFKQENIRRQLESEGRFQGDNQVKWNKFYARLMSDLKIFNDYYKIEEYDLVDRLPKVCKNVIPIKKFGNESVIMLYGDRNFMNIKPLSKKVAYEIIKIIGNTLKCLMDNGLYYFDMKSTNILYRCMDGKHIQVFLIDLGSMVPSNGLYTSTYVPPEKMVLANNSNMHYDNTRNNDPNHKNGFIRIDNMTKEAVGKMYVWQLSILYLHLKYNVGIVNNMVFDKGSDTYNLTRRKIINDKSVPKEIRNGLVFVRERLGLDDFLGTLN